MNTAEQSFYTESPQWHEMIGEIHALLERVRISEEQSGDVLRLRRLNRIMSIHASTAIEGNQLTLAQVSDVINGKPVWGPPKDIKEVQNAWHAYDAMRDLNPWSRADFLAAHALLTETLIGESGALRTVNVNVVRSDGTIVHRGSPPAKVPELIDELFVWGQTSPAHPLIKSSAIHYMIEHIHPFRDGNGRIGRLWQTLILARWKPIFAWMPIETLVHYNQALYYKALEQSYRDGVIDCRPFINFMLDAIQNSLYKYVDIATETEANGDDTVNDTVNDAVNDPVNPFGIVDLISANPSISYAQLVEQTGRSRPTVSRAIQKLKQQGILERVGSDKTGSWKVHRPAMSSSS